MSPDQFAVLILITQIGVAVCTNRNSKPHPKYYARLRLDGQDLISLCRFFYGVGEFEAVKFRGDSTDLRYENLMLINKGRPKHSARKKVLSHVEKLAKRAEQQGRLPESVTAEDFIANLMHFLSTIDVERAIGTHLPDIPKAAYYQPSSLAA